MSLSKSKKLVKRSEEKFHDQWADSTNINNISPIDSFNACSAPENRLIMKWLDDIRGKDMLELGCGLGEASVYFALQGANVTATDLSEGMLHVAEKLANKYDITIKTEKCSADELPFTNEIFDIVYGANLLHHVDIENTLLEVSRVLKPGGIFVSWDPLAHNPIINIYRKMANQVRTKDEHKLKIEELKLFNKYFCKVKFKCTWFFTLIIFLKFYLVDHIGVNSERYWKKILIEHKKLEKLYLKLEKLDKYCLNRFPVMNKFCWNIVVLCEKAG